MADLAPKDETEAAAIIAEAAATSRKLQVVGGGSKNRIGLSSRLVRQISTANFNRIIDYDPAELVLTVEPGARLADVEALLERHGQRFAFEPWDYADVTGAQSGAGTVGGVIGSGFSGSRRLSAGSVRDHLLGFRAINGRGEVFKAGGKVVKNVTGYDLSKLMAGSWGQLALLTEVTFKVLPKPPEEVTLALRGLSPFKAQDAMNRAMRSTAEVAAAAHVPGADAVTAVRLEGFKPSIEARWKLLSGLLADVGKLEPLESAGDWWRGVRSGVHVARDSGPLLWRIVSAPAHGAALLDGVAALGGDALLDWGGGLAWARTPVEATTRVRELAERLGGHAMLLDGPLVVRDSVPALHPEAPGVAALSRRVREAFDPAGVFDPERFAAGPA